MKLLKITLLLCVAYVLVACTDYDVSTADTQVNRAGFERHIGCKPGEEISGVYYYADELGADVRYQLRFACSKEEVMRLIEKLGLKQKPEDYSGLAPREDFTWWKDGDLEEVPMWVKTEKEDGGLRKELWYSEISGLCYYHEYSL